MKVSISMDQNEIKKAILNYLSDININPDELIFEVLYNDSTWQQVYNIRLRSEATL